MAYATFTDSGTMDELAHIPAGYGYVKYLDFRLNPEHPPLLKAISAFPLLFFDLNFPTDARAWTTDVNGQWEAGAKFLYESGNDADEIIRWSRLGPVLLTLALVLFIYFWAAELIGKAWALLPAFLFALSPTVLAHGHYVTTDVAAAFGVAFATYFFLKFLNAPSRHTRFFAGLAFGVAAVAKFSTALLVPYFFLLLFVHLGVRIWRDWGQGASFKNSLFLGWRLIRSLIVIFLVGAVFVIYPSYYLFTVNYPMEKQVSDTSFILGSFAGGPAPEGETCRPLRCLAELNISMAKQPLLRPFAQYLLGILMVIQRSAGGNTAYFLGEVSGTGSPWYFPIIYLLKEPVPVLALTAVALLFGIFRFLKGLVSPKNLKTKVLDYFTLNFSEFAMLLFVAIYWLWSVRSPLNIGYRHLLPTLPFLYILVASFWRGWITKTAAPPSEEGGLRRIWFLTLAFSRTSLKYLFLAVLLVWFSLETALAAPHFLSYFNQFGGGTREGYRYVTDSNYDWGQDLLRLKKWVEEHPEVDRIAVDYFGAGNPKYYLGAKAEGWWSSRGNPSTSSGQVPPIRWLAVSVNTLQGAIQPLDENHPRKPEDEYRWLTELREPSEGLGGVPEPDARAGMSMFIYKLF